MPNEAQSVASQVFVTDSHAVAWRPSQFAANVGVKDLGTANDRTMQFVRFRKNVVCGPSGSKPLLARVCCSMLCRLIFHPSRGKVFI